MMPLGVSSTASGWGRVRVCRWSARGGECGLVVTQHATQCLLQRLLALHRAAQVHKAAGTIPVAALVAEAIEDALAPFGVRVREMPLSPVRIRELIEEASSVTT